LGARRADERFDSEPIARENDVPVSFVDDCGGKHSVETGKNPDLPFLVPMDDDLGVAAGAEVMAPSFELATKNGVIIDLAIEGEVDVSALVRHWIDDFVRQIDHREAGIH